jgi:hypothetical protein
MLLTAKKAPLSLTWQMMPVVAGISDVVDVRSAAGAMLLLLLLMLPMIATRCR